MAMAARGNSRNASFYGFPSKKRRPELTIKRNAPKLATVCDNVNVECAFTFMQGDATYYYEKAIRHGSLRPE